MGQFEPTDNSDAPKLAGEQVSIGRGGDDDENRVRLESFQKDQDGATLRSHVFLCSTGTEEASANEHWSNVAVVFYRQDFGTTGTFNARPTTHRVHIPDQSSLDSLYTACCDVLSELRVGAFNALEEITAYLIFILDDDSAWEG